MATQNRKYIIAKIDPAFSKKIHDIALERIKTGIDKKLSKEQMSIRRYTKAMTRYPPLWELLKKAEFKEEDIR